MVPRHCFKTWLQNDALEIEHMINKKILNDQKDINRELKQHTNKLKTRQKQKRKENTKTHPETLLPETIKMLYLNSRPPAHRTPNWLKIFLMEKSSIISYARFFIDI